MPPIIRVFSSESTLHMRWPKYWSFSFSVIPSKENPWLISCTMDWLDLFAFQGLPKSLLQHHGSKASVLRCSAFFTVQLSHPYMTTGKTIALTRRNLVRKVMSLLLNMLSRLVITFLPRRLQSPSAIILEPKKVKSDLFLQEISPGISLEGMMLKLKLQYFGHLRRRVDSLEKTLMLGGIGRRRRRRRHRMRWLDGITDSMDMSQIGRAHV